MAKKSGKHRSQVANRRPNAPAVSRQAAVAPTTRPAAAAVPRPSSQPVQASPTPSAADLSHEYRYVLGDLRRVGILAASMFALLIAIALVAQLVIK